MNSVATTYAVEFLENWLEFRSRQVDLPGFSVAIYHKGQPVFSHAYGMADEAMEVPLTPDHLFAIASQSKMFTATAVLQLVQKNLIQLDAAAVIYLPWLAKHPSPAFSQLTVRQLLSHGAGLLRDGQNSDYWQGEADFPTQAELRKIILNADLVVQPNTKMKYSNMGFALLGQIIEVVSGQRYAAYINQHIIKPLDLQATYPDWTPAISHRLALGYTTPYEQKRTPVITTRPTRALAPAAGFVVSPSDMCRFASTHMADEASLLSTQLTHEAQRSQRVVLEGYDKGYEYGLGFEIIHVSNRRLIGHGGSSLGYRSATFFEPNAGLVVSVAANSKDAPIMAMIRGIFSALFHFEDTAKEKTPGSLAHFNALMRGPLATVQVIATEQAIVAIDPDDWEPLSWSEQLQTISKNTLRITTPNSIHGEGEKIRYHFINKHEVSSVDYGGLTLAVNNPAWASSLSTHNDSEPFTLPQEPAEALFLHYLRQSKHSFFRLEILPEYDLQPYEEAESLDAWLKGKTNKSIALLEKLTTHDAELPPWISVWPKVQAKNSHRIRVRVVDGDFTPYMQWEVEHFKRINVQLCGEKIFYLPKKYLTNTTLPAGDIIMCNGHTIVNRYVSSKLTHRTFYKVSQLEAKRFTALKNQVLHQAMQHGLQLDA